MLSLFILIAAQTPPAPEVVIEKKKEVCNTVKMTGSRVRTVRRCTKPRPDPQDKIDDLEAKQAVDFMLQQDRIDHAACVQSKTPKC